MFHTIITLAYIIPNIYVFLRIWQLFINKGYKIYYTVIYLLLASFYPLSNQFNVGNAGILTPIFTTIDNYILPFYLYMFLSVLVFDIFLLINYIFKFVPADRFSSTRFKVSCLSAILLTAAGVVVAGIINFNTIRTSEYHIEIHGKSSGINHLRITFAADFHLNYSTSVNFVERFVKNIEDINPDIMLFGGDIVEGDREDGNLLVFENLLKTIKPKYGVFTVLGNHEYYAGQDEESFFDKAGMKVLCDTILSIDNAFSLGGRYDSHFRTRKSINDFMKSNSDSLPLIVVDHRPTEILKVSSTNTDIHLSGHTHNGQLFPINLITRSVYELSWGYRKIRNTHFFVTSGIRLWGPPVRTTGKSEIMVIDVSFTGR
jgi:predicted MPP superfamily phosphohydrolase